MQVGLDFENLTSKIRENHGHKKLANALFIRLSSLSMKDKIAYCGLNCEKCDAYIATINDDQELREKTAKLWAELNNAPILPEHIVIGHTITNLSSTFQAK